MIAGAFGFDYVMLVISAKEGIMPQTIEHIQILELLDIKNLIVVITKKKIWLIVSFYIIKKSQF